MLPSIDSTGFIHSYRHRPPDEELTERGWMKGKKKGINDSIKWISNGLKGTHEPRLSLYETWEKTYRLRADLSIPKFLYGANVRLPDEAEIQEALEIITNNIELRSGLKFDAFSANMCRLDYSVNLKFDPKLVKAVIGRYRNFDVVRLLRHTIGNETVYFENKSRKIKIYDKHAEVCAKKMSPDVQAQSQGIVRAEYGLLDADSIRNFAARLGFQGTSANEMLSQENIHTAHRELSELLKFDSINFSPDRKIKIAFEQINDVKRAIQLSGFVEAVDCFGEGFYRNEAFKMSKSTYDRNLRECQDLGLI